MTANFTVDERIVTAIKNTVAYNANPDVTYTVEVEYDNTLVRMTYEPTTDILMYHISGTNMIVHKHRPLREVYYTAMEMLFNIIYVE